MAAVEMGSNLQERASRPGPSAAWTLRTCWLSRGLALSLGLNPVRADVVFQNCVPVAGGGITCDTRPEGNTLMNDEAARYGLFDQASPGWDEFEPYQGYDDMFGGNET